MSPEEIERRRQQITDDHRKALDRIRDGETLDPKKVVDVARDPKHILHPFFQWDDSVAGERYRYQQACNLIARITVYNVSHEQRDRVYVSLVQDRDDGGYRKVSETSKKDITASLTEEIVRLLVRYRSMNCSRRDMERCLAKAMKDDRLEQVEELASAGA